MVYLFDKNKEAMLDFDNDDVRPYFSLENVIKKATKEDVKPHLELQDKEDALLPNDENEQLINKNDNNNIINNNDDDKNIIINDNDNQNKVINDVEDNADEE